MPTYYVDPAAAGAANGTSWTDAWTTLQTAVDTAAAGDIVYCRGSQTLGAPIDIDQNNGAANARIRVIGCNAAGNVDGTRFTLNGNSSAANCIAIAAAKGAYWWFENITFTAATGNGMSLAAGAGSATVWINCLASSNGGYGFNAYYAPSGTTQIFVRCQSINNSSDGFYKPYYGVAYIACKASGNGGSGFWGGAVGSLNLVYGCVSHNNTTEGVDSDAGPIIVVNSVIDENGSDGIFSDCATPKSSIVIGNRLTGNGTGGTGYGILEGGTGYVVYGWNFFLNNDGVTSGDCHAIASDADADTNETSGTEGYTDGDNDDFNLTSLATLRSVAIEID